MPVTRDGSSSVPRTPEPQVTITSSITRSEKRIIEKEDAVHILDNLWDADEEDALYKIFLKQASKQGMLEFLLHSKEELQELSYVELDESELQLQKYEIGKNRKFFFTTIIFEKKIWCRRIQHLLDSPPSVGRIGIFLRFILTP